MEAPNELSLLEIRKYMLANGCKVTNHALVKHFKRFLTNPDTQNEARKQFKTYVNILSTIKNENDQKYLILRKKYLHECPTEEMALRTDVPSSPGGISLVTEGLASPFRQPPPYKPPPEVSSPSASKLPVLQAESADNYRECINEFAAAVRLIDSSSRQKEESPIDGGDAKMESVVENKNERVTNMPQSVVPAKVKRENSIESDNKENLSSRSSFSSVTSSMESSEKTSSDAENPMSVKEATRKFNRMASEEEAKIISPPSKKKPEKVIEEKMTPEVTLSHPKGKEWVVSSAKANYQELAKLASEYPELVKLQDPTTGYTALHWAAKHGNEDVVKLIAGTYKADVNARTNGGYTPLHLAMQFGREDIFELLCNVYKANRDLMDWSGNKPLDYHKQRTSVSASTYSKIKARRKHTEKDLGFLRIGSLNVRVKKTTEAFSNFLGVGNGNGHTNSNMTTTAGHQHHHHHRHHPHAMGAANPMMRTIKPLGTSTQLVTRASVPINTTNKFEKIHKTWGSADNIPRDGVKGMPPPKGSDSLKNRKSKRNNTAECRTTLSGYSSMPTTPNQLRAPIGILSEQVVSMGDSDSDVACGFGSNWSVSRSSLTGGGQANAANAPVPRYA